MVVFTCNNCGDSLQKPRVIKHLQFSCRKPPSLTCVDCLKDFRGNEYVAHTKCVTEAERYGGKDYIPKPNANKGERKQQEWLNIVNNLLKMNVDLSPAERSILEKILKFENIPRKKAKFFNFIFSMDPRLNKTIVDNIWAKMEAAQPKPVQNGATPSKPGDIGELDESNNLNDSISEDKRENNIAENENNENISRESKNQKEQNEGIKSGKKKKSRKRDLSESSKNADEQSSPKKKTQTMSNGDAESLEQGICEDELKKSAFDWKNAICTVMSAKQEISLKKLQKKIVAQYINHCSGAVSYEAAVSKFNKKLKKNAEVIVTNDKVKLA